MTGYRASKPNESHTHMLYTVDEHDKQENTIHQLKRDIEVLKAECSKEINKTIREANEHMKNAKENADKRINDIKNKLNEANEKAKHFENMNSNLIRIAKERANAQRKIKPKKEHNGYVLQNIEEAVYIHKDTNKRKFITTNLPCWRVRFQTPYIISLDIKTVKSTVDNDFRNKISQIIGIGTFFKEKNFDLNDYTTETVNNLWTDKEEYKNFIFKTNFKLNAIKGFWEVEYWVRDMIEVTPEILANAD